MSNDLISRQAAIEAMRELPHEYNTKEQRARTGGIAACQTIIRELPSVHPKTGQWEHDRCTECGKSLEDLFSGEFYYDAEEVNFCPNCGARMEDYENE